MHTNIHLTFSLFLSLFFILKFPDTIHAQYIFHKSYDASAAGGGSPSISTGKCAVKQTSDSGYIIAGSTSLGAGSTDLILIRTTETGDTLWIKTYGGASDNEYGHDVIQTSDGGFMAVGKSYSFGPGWYDAYFVKTDSAGNVLWSKTVGGAQNDVARSVIQTSDGGYVSLGETENFGAGGLDFYLIKLDSSGNLLWTKTFGGSGTEYGYSVKECYDNGFILAGYTGSFGVIFWDMYLVKTDSTGAFQWSGTFGSSIASSDERAYSVIQTSDSAFVLTGYSSHLGTAGSWDIMCVKVDSLGSLVWNKTYGGSGIDIGFDLTETASGSIIITGQHTNASTSVALSIDKNGSIQWAKQFGALSYGNTFSVCETAGNGLAYLGRAAGSFYLIKTNHIGQNGCSDSNISLSSDSIPVITGTGGLSSSGGTNISAATIVTIPVIPTAVSCFTACPLPIALFSWTYNQNIVSFTNNSSSGFYSWDFGDGSPINYTSDPVHTFTPNSNYQVCLTVSDNCGLITLCDSVPVFTTSLSEYNMPEILHVFPSPAISEINVISSYKGGFFITDISGKIVAESSIPKLSSSQSKWDVTGLSSGIYFIRSGSLVKKFVKL